MGPRGAAPTLALLPARLKIYCIEKICKKSKFREKIHESNTASFISTIQLQVAQ